MTTNVPLGHSGGWNVAKRGALLTLSHARGHLITVGGLTWLGQSLNQWARDPEIYAVTLDPSVLQLTLADVAADADSPLADVTWRLECFSKPVVSLMDGDVGEVGLALALAGTHLVAGDDFRLTCPSFTRGRLPPGGLMAVLSQPSAHAALVHLLNGGHVGQAEALSTGLAGFAIAAQEFPIILEALAVADPVDPVLDDRHAPPTAGMVSLQSGPAIRFSELVAATAADVRRLNRDTAIVTVFQIDQALAQLGADASPAALRDAAAKVALKLPSRRDLQDFRKA